MIEISFRLITTVVYVVAAITTIAVVLKLRAVLISSFKEEAALETLIIKASNERYRLLAALDVLREQQQELLQEKRKPGRPRKTNKPQILDFRKNK